MASLFLLISELLHPEDAKLVVPRSSAAAAATAMFKPREAPPAPTAAHKAGGGKKHQADEEVTHDGGDWAEMRIPVESIWP